jgi:hypothetical protein
MAKQWYRLAEYKATNLVTRAEIQTETLPSEQLVVPILSNRRHEAVALAYVTSPQKIGWRVYQSVYPKSSQHAAETGFSRMLKNVEFRARVAELQAGAAADAEITLEALLREAADIQHAAMAAKQYAAANSALKLKAELSGQYVQRKEDVNNKHLATDWSTDELVAFIAGVEASVRGSEKMDSPARIRRADACRGEAFVNQHSEDVQTADTLGTGSTPRRRWHDVRDTG